MKNLRKYKNLLFILLPAAFWLVAVLVLSSRWNSKIKVQAQLIQQQQTKVQEQSQVTAPLDLLEQERSKLSGTKHDIVEKQNEINRAQDQLNIVQNELHELIILETNQIAEINEIKKQFRDEHNLY